MLPRRPRATCQRMVRSRRKTRRMSRVTAARFQTWTILSRPAEQSRVESGVKASAWTAAVARRR